MRLRAVLHYIQTGATCARYSYTTTWFRITSAPLQEVSTDKQVTDEEVKTLLATSLKSKKKNKKKKTTKVENGAKDAEPEQ